jgi:hypothetical protein
MSLAYISGLPDFYFVQNTETGKNTNVFWGPDELGLYFRIA